MKEVLWRRERKVSTLHPKKEKGEPNNMQLWWWCDVGLVLHSTTAGMIICTYMLYLHRKEKNFRFLFERRIISANSF